MTDLDRLRDLVRAVPNAKGEPIVVLDGADEDAAVDALMCYFDGADERNGVGLVIGGQRVGHLSRADALLLIEDSTRGGWGSSAGGMLPGAPRYEMLRLRCPVPGCPSEDQLRMRYDENKPPRCSVHPDVGLELV